MTDDIIFNPWNVVLFMANLFIYFFKCSLYVFLINRIVRKLISEAKVWRYRRFSTLTEKKNARKLVTSCKLFIGIIHISKLTYSKKENTSNRQKANQNDKSL